MKPNGGPAFPSPDNSRFKAVQGMSLRAYYAGEFVKARIIGAHVDPVTADSIRLCVAAADVLIAELNKD